MAVSPNDDRVLITAEGFEQLHRELERLRTTERRRLAELLREARGDGVLEDNPTLIAYNQELWAANLDYAKRKPKTSLETFRRVRAENYELLKDLPPAAYGRTGNHTENGPVTLLHLLETYAGHAESHARQLQEIRAVYKSARGKAK